jgi:hypothetical protein
VLYEIVLFAHLATVVSNYISILTKIVHNFVIGKYFYTEKSGGFIQSLKKPVENPTLINVMLITKTTEMLLAIQYDFVVLSDTKFIYK